MKHLVMGILAHVDAGKTTLSESILYTSGSIRKLGRVDNGDAFLDTYDLERQRGITIFSKQAVFAMGDKQVTLLDTPGHVDFSAEMERTLQVLDYAVLVISGADGVQGHTQTLWQLLNRYQIPVFLFINKMDQNGTDKEKLMAELKKRLSESCVDFSGYFEKERNSRQQWLEELAMCDESVLEQYLETGQVGKEATIALIKERKVFPCCFGSALKMTGVAEFLEILEQYTKEPVYGDDFGARVYKISRDDQGSRLTHMKITGGSLKVKSVLGEEKADQIRLYSGTRYELFKEAEAGCICAVTGLDHTFAGQGLGFEAEAVLPVLQPVMTYEIRLPEGCDIPGTLGKLRQLEEEEPQLHIFWNEELGEIHAQLMGEVQIEILTRLIEERFGISVEFGTGNIVYKETIENVVEGVGHFEPLRHYAEVHLLMEPGSRGSGLEFAISCSEDVLDRNWQRLVLTHLEEKEHRGVLTGSAITDMRITLVSGRAHLKHTEGGDFRQATYRAVRQGLKKANSILLEPVYEFCLELPAEYVGRALTDIQRMHGEFLPPEIDGELAVVSGTAPVAAMRDYQREVISYTRGHGRLSCRVKDYEPCHNAEEVIREASYDPEGDLENPTGSVFCAHGAGFVVPWDQVEDYMHLERVLKKEEARKEGEEVEKAFSAGAGSWTGYGTSRSDNRSKDFADEKELEAIFERTYGPVKKKNPGSISRIFGTDSNTRKQAARAQSREEYLLVDGYNIIFAWEDLKDLAQTNIDGARTRLMDILCNYQGYKKCHVILVFDAYKVEGNPGTKERYHNIHVVYTKEAETADQYIEKVAHEMGRSYDVTVATSDCLEQMIILGQGCRRLSAKGLLEEVELVNAQIRKDHLNRPQRGNKNYLFDHLEEGMADHMEEIRLGEKTLVGREEDKKS